jgi:putative sugar O-methyltransferase
MQNELDLLDIMLEDMECQDGIYQPGPFWKGYSIRTSQAIKRDGLENFRSNSRIGKGYADVSITDPLDLLPFYSWKSFLLRQTRRLPVFKTLIKRYNRINRKHIDQNQHHKSLYFSSTLGDWFSDLRNKYDLPNTLAGDPDQTLFINKIEIGEAYLRMFAWIDAYSTVVDFSKARAVFEIGGGFGSYAHTMLTWFPNIRKYLYLDIPPTLYVGTQYLKHFFGSDVIDYTATRNLDTIRFSKDDKREIIAICPWQIEKVDDSFDFFWNSSSFQEMPLNVVSNYADNIGRLFKKSNNPKMGMFFYKGGKPEKTLRLEDLSEIVSSNLPVEFEELDVGAVKRVIDGHALFFRDNESLHSSDRA